MHLTNSERNIARFIYAKNWHKWKFMTKAKIRREYHCFGLCIEKLSVVFWNKQKNPIHLKKNVISVLIYSSGKTDISNNLYQLISRMPSFSKIYSSAIICGGDLKI